MHLGSGAAPPSGPVGWASGTLPGLDEQQSQVVKIVAMAVICVTIVWQLKCLSEIGAYRRHWTQGKRRRATLFAVVLSLASAAGIVALTALGALSYLVIVLLVAVALSVVISAIS